MAKQPKYEGLKERVAALEKENQELRKGLAKTEVLMKGNQVDEDLRSSKEKYRIVADFAYDWEMWISPSGECLYASPSCERITGYLAEEFKTDAGLFWRILHPDDLARVEKHHRDEAEGSGRIHSIDFRIINRRGEERWINHHCQPVYGRDMCFLGRRVSNRDITERKRAEDALRQSEANVRALINNPANSMLLVNPDGIIIESNQIFAQRMGRRVDELIGRCVYDFFPPELAKSRRARVDEIVRLGVPVRYEEERAGMWLDQSAYPVLDPQGRVVRISVVARDITERKQVEEAFRESEEKYRSLFENMLDAFAYCRMIFDDQERPVDFVYLKVNSAFERLTGLENVVGKKATELIPGIKESNPELFEIYDRVALTGKPEKLEIDFKPLARWLSISVYSTQKGYFVAVFDDITGRKRAEEELKQAEERYRGIFENAVEGIFQTTTEGRYLSANPALAKMHGYDSPQDLIASVSDVGHQHYVNPEYRTSLQKALKEHGSVKRFVTEVYRKDGSRIWVSINARAVRGSDGGTLFYEGRVEDISEHRRVEEALRVSEEQYRKLFEGALDGIVLADPDTGINLDCNDAFLKLVERERDEVVGKPQKILHPPENALRDVTRSFEEHRTTGQGQVIATKLLTKTGKLKDVEIKANFNEIGNKKVLQGVFRDITDRVKAKQEREEIRSQLYQSQKMETLGTLVAGVAHEINNPINLIMFNVPLLQKVWRDIQPILVKHALHEPHKKYGGLTSEFLKQDLDKLLRDMDLAANRVATIVSGLKDFAKMSDIRDKTPIQINQAVTNSMRLAQTTLKKAEIDVELELGQDLPLIEGNLPGLEQIVLNLIVNAIQAIENENGRIRVKTGLDERKGQIVVVVSDNGRGIDPSTYGRIFDPFFTNRQAYGGTGLGLAISYSMAKAHDGEISFESEVGRGTTFTVTLPVTPRGKRARVLVADDDELQRDLIASAFAIEQRYSVEQASTGTEALLKIGSFRPDLVVLDVFMPDMDGLEVCRALKKDPRLSGIKVIIITGHAGDSKLDQIKRLGFEQILGKPLHVGDLLHAADKVFGEGERGNRQ